MGRVGRRGSKTSAQDRYPTTDLPTYPTTRYPPYQTTRLLLPSIPWLSPAGIRYAICSRFNTGSSDWPRPAPQGWAPAVDLCETADAFIVTAELPVWRANRCVSKCNDGRITLQGRRDARVPASSTTRSSAATASSRARSALPAPVERRTDRRRPPRRRPHDRGAESARKRSAPRRRLLPLETWIDARPHAVITGFDHDQASLARPRLPHRRARSPASCLPAACAATTRGGATGGAPRAGRRAASADAAVTAAPGPTSRASPKQTVRAVANISSIQVVRQRTSPFFNDPFFQQFFGDPTACSARATATPRASAPASSSRPTATSSPTTTYSARAAIERGHRRARRQARARSQDRRRRHVDRSRAPEDRRDQPAGDSVGRFVAAARSPSG